MTSTVDIDIDAIVAAHRKQVKVPGGSAFRHSIDTTIRMVPTSGVEPKHMTFYVRKNRIGRAPMSANNRLQLCQASEFEIIISTPRGNWAPMGADWSGEAEPGNWVRRRSVNQLINDHNGKRRAPEGMVISSTHDFETDRMQFLIHWFK